MAGYLALKSMENNGNAMQNGGGNNAPGGDGEDFYKQEMLTAVQTDEEFEENIEDDHNFVDNRNDSNSNFQGLNRVTAGYHIAACEHKVGYEESSLSQELIGSPPGDEEKLREAVKNLPPKCLNHVYQHPTYSTALHVATQNNSANLVGILLQAKADPNARDLRGKKYCPLHYAAHNGNAEVLKILLKNHADGNTKEGEFGRSALHILANRWKTNEDAFKDALDVLLDWNRIKVDIPDVDGTTPLFLAATKGWEYMVRALILKGADLERAVGNKTASDIINKKLPGLLGTIDIAQIETPKRHFSDELYGALKEQNLPEFRNLLNEITAHEEKNKLTIIEEDHGDNTLLTYACDNGLYDFVVELLKNGANPTLRDDVNKISPLLYATRNGYHKILDILIATMKDRGDLEKGALKHCDRRKETALHKVVKREYQAKDDDVDYYRCLQLLLEQKRFLNIDATDEFQNTPLHYAVLCDDQSFVRTLLLNGSHLGIRNKFGTLAITRIQASVLEEVLNDSIKYKNNLADRDFEIILHYSLLAPAEASQQPETECLRFLSASKKHKHLLRHPVIDTFLFLKWQRIKQYFFINIIAYTLFLILLTAYILIYHGTYKPVSADNSTSEVNSSTVDMTDSIEEKLANNFVLKCFLQALIAILTLYIAGREAVQFCVSWRLYLTRFENWLEVSIVVLTVLLLFIPLSVDVIQSLSAWLILFSWTEFILLLGRHPIFAVYITMFSRVTYNFLLFIAMFSFLVIAFSISFFLVFQVNEHFTTYHQALLKTLAMTTGELEYTDLPLTAFPVSSHLLFLVFVFLIVLVLMNLLNGLAVSDIQEIRQEAEIVSYISRVELIAYIESVFLASPIQRILPGPITCCENGGEDCYVVACLDSPNPGRKLLNWMGRRTLMFRSCLRDRKITVYPNRGTDRWHICKCHSFHIKEAQIEAAKDVVMEKENTETGRRLSGMEDRLDQVMAALISLTDKVNKHVLCPSPQ